jgi:hypothetical protein
LIDLQDDFEGPITIMAKIVHRNERSLNETMFLVQRNNLKVPMDKWLNLLIEDDTTTAYATISRFKYPSLGLQLINEYSIGDWFIFGGMARTGRRIYIDKFRYLGTGTQSFVEKSFTTH